MKVLMYCTAACPFCSEERGPTLVGDFNQATMVLVGTFQNPLLGKGGLEDGTRIRLAGKGEEGPGGRGDAIVTVEIAPHRFFTREGNNIRLNLPVTLKEAVLGAKVKVPTPDGPVMLTIPKGTTSGRVLRLKGRGFAAKDGKRGDQLVEGPRAVADRVLGRRIHLAEGEGLAGFPNGGRRRDRAGHGTAPLVAFSGGAEPVPSRHPPGQAGGPGDPGRSPGCRTLGLRD